uniref:Uncharacterized protein n=1 Tax=Chromera velia CCMP2878 TaxID=1169474 RepID=A0A0G4GA07_9ALVE|eukprot:Cvel_20813.t1-p1 / transcript=Cvel_20813.t1 / gene=Cvel_20813 / organism=Chromera_velia_CCMP2878 / gene_product=hypothetical protein / transcript_product=hypothetical protein / location=Cvel_scaffold1902:21720-23760(+) / protein_length=179 / sequence_SO=supercontig / SO=protein_coding / is_pseudo=false
MDGWASSKYAISTDRGREPWARPPGRLGTDKYGTPIFGSRGEEAQKGKKWKDRKAEPAWTVQKAREERLQKDLEAMHLHWQERHTESQRVMKDREQSVRECHRRSENPKRPKLIDWYYMEEKLSVEVVISRSLMYIGGAVRSAKSGPLYDHPAVLFNRQRDFLIEKLMKQDFESEEDFN